MVAGGLPPEPSAVGLVRAGAYVVAADSGVDHALALGLRIDCAVGDFDSISPAGLAAIETAGVRIERHPAAKDAVDLELALDLAVQSGAARLAVIGGAGGRLDHLLGTLILLAEPAYAAVEITARLGTALVTVIRNRRTLTGDVGELVSLLPMHGPARRVQTTGLRWPLDRDLEPARGISNEFTEPTATVRIGGGVVLAIQPGTGTDQS